MPLEQTVADLVTQVGTLTTQVDASVQAAIDALNAGTYDDTQVQADIDTLEAAMTAVQTAATALTATVGINTTDITALQAEDVNLQAQIDVLDAGGYDDTQVQADIDALEAAMTAVETAATALTATVSTNTTDIGTNTTDIATNAAAITALQSSQVAPSGLAVAPNRFYTTRKFTKLCNGTLNSPLQWDSGGVNAPYTAAWSGGASGTCEIEVVDVQDTTRLSALGIPRTGNLLNLSIDPTSPQFYIAVIDMQCTTAPISGAFFHLFFAAQPLLGNELVIPTASNYFTYLTKVESSAWFNAMTMDAGFQVNLGSPFTLTHITDADDGLGWLYKHSSDYPYNPNPGIHFKVLTAKPGGGVAHFAIALPYYGFGDHGGAYDVWAESTQDVIDGL